MLLQVPMLLRASASGRMENGLRSHSLRSTCNKTLQGEGRAVQQHVYRDSCMQFAVLIACIVH